MKNLLGFFLVLFIGFLLGALSLALCLPVRAGAGGSVATSNGDTNGDGNIDISDAVHLLNFLFTGGAELAQISCPDRPKSCLVATGQKDCAGTASIIDCSALKARGQDAYYQLGCPSENRFVDHGDGMVSDNCTGLMWTKYHVDTDGDGEILPADEMTWLEGCNFAEDMTYLGHDDWRVPNIQELLSLVSFGEAYGAAAPFFAPFTHLSTDKKGTFSSTHLLGGGAALTVHLASYEHNDCHCCLIGYIYPEERHPFIAVRGP